MGVIDYDSAVRLARLVDRIEAFREGCEREEYTDTGVAHELLNAISMELEQMIANRYASNRLAAKGK